MDASAARKGRRRMTPTNTPPSEPNVPTEAVSQDEFALDPKDWEVEVRIGGVGVLTIGHSHLSGLSDIDRYADTVRLCGEHLLAFIGTGEPTPCFYCSGVDIATCDPECPICNPEALSTIETGTASRLLASEAQHRDAQKDEPAQRSEITR